MLLDCCITVLVLIRDISLFFFLEIIDRERERGRKTTKKKDPYIFLERKTE